MAFDLKKEQKYLYTPKTASEKKKPDCSLAELSVAAMQEYLKQKGYVEDIFDTRRYHEIYLTNAKKTSPEKWKTIIRHPVCEVLPL